MVRTCPACGFPNEKPYSLPKLVDDAANFDMWLLKCHCCGTGSYNYEWKNQRANGEFDWPEAMDAVQSVRR